MAIQPIDYTGPNSGFLQGLQTAAAYKQNQQQNQAIDSENQFKQDWQGAYGNPEAMSALAAKYPDQMQNIAQGIGYQDANHQAALGAAAGDLRVAMATGNSQAVMSAAQQHASTLQSVGSSPDEVATMYQNDPQHLGQLVDAVGMTSLGPQGYYNTQTKNTQLNQQGAATNATLQLGQQRLQQQYQQSQFDNQLNQQKFQHQIQQDNTQNGFTAQKVDIQRGDQAIKQQMANQSGQQQSSNIQNQQFQQVQKKQDFVNGYDQQVNSTSGMLTTLNQVKQIDPSTFNSIWGAQGYVNRNLPGSDSADAYSQIQQMQAQARQMGVIGMRGTGPVSDSEGQAAASAFLNLQPNVSSDRARTIINNWQQVLQRQVNYLNSQKSLVDKYRSDVQSYSGPQQSAAPQVGQSEGGYTFTGGDPSSPNSWRKN
ncbi:MULTISPECIES: phage DNA ejection protein [unclassified Tatumella]|uniref:phage DNA ejection protein n=1 Tax=unclassified Tatumella TaxID=2649542 RepID=UPI001BAF3D8D|nr:MULTISPECIES: phage DNA ejection protein [unclassified Tatumella]MBS0878391.1 phage DNA ejection protein [Tatumella sp. JGM82]MBS0891187.1 phage DNA ejection protein [Tatumella sp. JGM94]MBS0902744.1 phage DNA ejection protein [Tatumella sp. JGM100]